MSASDALATPNTGHVGGKIDLHLAQLLGIYCQDMAIESVDSAGDAHRFAVAPTPIQQSTLQ